MSISRWMWNLSRSLFRLFFVIIFTANCNTDTVQSTNGTTQILKTLYIISQLECGPMPNVMVALSNIGAPSVQHRKVWLTPTAGVPCSNAVKKWKPLKFVGVPQTCQQISAASGPKFAILRGHLEDILLFNKFFSDCLYCLSSEDVAGQSCAMVLRWRFFATFLRPLFPASRLQHVSDLHPKFTLRPHHVSKYGRHPMCDRWH